MLLLNSLSLSSNFNGDWWGQDRWGNSVRALRGANELAEKALADAVARISPDVLTYDDEAQYYLVDEPASVLRGGMLTAVYGSFEFSLLLLCDEAAALITKTGYDRAQERARGAAKCRIEFLGSLVGRDFYTPAEDFRPIQLLRNIVTHSDGLLPNPEDRPKDAEAITKWLKRNPTLVSASGVAIRLNSGFISYTADYLDSLFGSISEALRATPEAEEAAKAHKAWFSRFISEPDFPDESH